MFFSIKGCLGVILVKMFLVCNVFVDGTSIENDLLDSCNYLWMECACLIDDSSKNTFWENVFVKSTVEMLLNAFLVSV